MAIAIRMAKLHSALPHAIISLLIHNSCKYFPNCTLIYVSDLIVYSDALSPGVHTEKA